MLQQVLVICIQINGLREHSVSLWWLKQPVQTAVSTQKPCDNLCTSDGIPVARQGCHCRQTHTPPSFCWSGRP